jgi:hypothetical protein
MKCCYSSNGSLKGGKMAKNLQIVSSSLSLNFNVKYNKLDKAERPPVTAKAPNGAEVKEKAFFKDQQVQQGEITKRWVDDLGNQYGKTELSFWYEGEQVEEIKETKVFEVEGFSPLSNYNDSYVVKKYYEVYPSNNGMKKDFDRKRAESANLAQMKKLWDYLKKEQVLARGEFNPSSRGFIASDAYIRAVEINGLWGLEIGVFSEERVFEHLNEMKPIVVPQEQPVAKKLKRV